MLRGKAKPRPKPAQVRPVIPAVTLSIPMPDGAGVPAKAIEPAEQVIHAVPAPTEPEGQKAVHVRLHVLLRRLERADDLTEASRVSTVIVALGDLRQKAQMALVGSGDDDVNGLMVEIMDF